MIIVIIILFYNLAHYPYHIIAHYIHLMMRAGAEAGARASGPKHRRLRHPSLTRVGTLIAAHCSLLQLITAYCSFSAIHP